MKIYLIKSIFLFLTYECLRLTMAIYNMVVTSYIKILNSSLNYSRQQNECGKSLDQDFVE
jgi:hypothetical protein